MNNNTKRKRGRPAGSTSFIRVRLVDLVGHLGSKGNVVVSKKWLEDIGFSSEKYCAQLKSVQRIELIST